METTRLQRFRMAYAAHRAAEGRGEGGIAEFFTLPYLREGPHARSWRVRARTYDAFVEHVVNPLAAAAGPRPLRILDLGAGNGWLAHRMTGLGHQAVAVDVRDDAVDGLGAAPRNANPFHRITATFDAVPLREALFDVIVFNASLHYSADLAHTLREAVRVLRSNGRIAILDSPFYARETDGEKMVALKRATAATCFGERAADLLGIGSIEYLTDARLHAASSALRLQWRRHRVRYPLRYELRSVVAALRGARRPSRFDIREAWLT